MFKRIAIVVAAVLSLFLIAFTGMVLWAIMFAHGSVGATLANGRSLTASADSIYISLETNKDTATIRTFGRTVVVAPTNLQVDGRSVATIPAATKSVSIAIEDGEVTFVADGQDVGSVRR